MLFKVTVSSLNDGWCTCSLNISIAKKCIIFSLWNNFLYISNSQCGRKLTEIQIYCTVFRCSLTRVTASILEAPMDEWTIKTPNLICRLFFKIDLLTDFAALCLTDFIDWRYIHTVVCIFDPGCEPLPPWMQQLYLCTVAPLLYLLSDLPPSFPN